MSSMMQQLSGMVSSVVQPPAAAPKAEGPQDAQRVKDAAPVRAQRPAVDEYVPTEKPEPIGLYQLGRDEGGRPKIYFDDPERVADGPDGPSKAPGPGKEAAGDKAERCTCSTDQVDREIEKLRQHQKELERQIRAQTDAAKIRGLEQKLAQVENELSQKDNDAYRRQHAVFSW